MGWTDLRADELPEHITVADIMAYTGLAKASVNQALRRWRVPADHLRGSGREAVYRTAAVIAARDASPGRGRHGARSCIAPIGDPLPNRPHRGHQPQG